MARYEHLPIYRQAFDLLLWIENAVRGFSRYHTQVRDRIGSSRRSARRREAVEGLTPRLRGLSSSRQRRIPTNGAGLLFCVRQRGEQ